MNLEKSEKKAAIYCRVSTYMQGAADYSSLDAQEDQLKAFCKGKNWEVVSVYKDTKTGTTLDRDELNRLLVDAENGKFDVIVATKIDRFSRSIADFYELTKRLGALNVGIVSATQPIDTSTSAGKLMQDIFMAFAQFERNMIAERTRESLFARAAKGFWGGGHAPLGYDVKDKTLIINEEEAKLVKRIYAYYLEMHSVNKVAEKLNKEGAETKKRTSKDRMDGHEKTTGGDEFNKDSVARILKNKVYLGKIVFNNEEFAGLHEAIIDQEIFDKAQSFLEESKTNKHISNESTELLLLGVLKCGFCGSSMTTTFSTHKDGQKYYYYKCVDKSKYGAGKCSCKDVPAGEIEDFVLKLVHKISSSDILFDAVFQQLNQNEDTELLTLKEKRRYLTNNLEKIKTENKNLINFISQGQALGEFQSIQDKLKDLEQKKNSVEIEIKDIDDKIGCITSQEVDKEELKELFSDVTNMLPSLSKKEQKELIRTIINEISWKLKSKEKEGEIEIAFRGNGRINKKWVNSEVNPLVSSFSLDWLRE